MKHKQQLQKQKEGENVKETHMRMHTCEQEMKWG